MYLECGANDVYLECGVNDVYLTCVFSRPWGEILWYMYNTWMSQLSFRGSICDSGGIVGSSYVMVSALKCVMTCKSEKGPLWGSRLWYQLGSIFYENHYRVWVVFGSKSCPMEGLLDVIFRIRMGIPIPYPMLSLLIQYFISGE